MGWGNACVFPKQSLAYTEAAHTRLEATTSTLWRGWQNNRLSSVEFIPPTHPSYEAAEAAMLQRAHALDKGPMECSTAADLRRCQQAALQDMQDKPTYGPLWLVPCTYHGLKPSPASVWRSDRILYVMVTTKPASYSAVISQDHVLDTQHYEEQPHFTERMTNFDYEGGWELARCPIPIPY